MLVGTNWTMIVRRTRMILGIRTTTIRRDERGRRTMMSIETE